MASARAQEVANLLWEMKKAGKIGTHTAVARKAGFAPGASGRTIMNTLVTVRRDWSHLQWWRVVPDDGVIDADGEQALALAAGGFELKKAKDKKTAVMHMEECCMVWVAPEVPVEEVAEVEEAEEVETDTDDEDDDE